MAMPFGIASDFYPNPIASYPQGYSRAVEDFLQSQPAIDTTMRSLQMPSGVQSPFEAGTPQAASLNDPQNWGLTPGDLESPLAYMGGGPFVAAPRNQYQWKPRDYGGWFTLDQLYGQRRPDSAGMGQQVPDMFQYKSNWPSTNNWRLLGMGPNWIMRNGMLINVDENARWGLPTMYNMSASPSAEHGMGHRVGIAPGKGGKYGGVPSIGGGSELFWPGGPIIGYERWPASNV